MRGKPEAPEGAFGGGGGDDGGAAQGAVDDGGSADHPGRPGGSFAGGDGDSESGGNGIKINRDCADRRFAAAGWAFASDGGTRLAGDCGHRGQLCGDGQNRKDDGKDRPGRRGENQGDPTSGGQACGLEGDRPQDRGDQERVGRGGLSRGGGGREIRAKGRLDAGDLRGLGGIAEEKFLLHASGWCSFRSHSTCVEAVRAQEAGFDVVGQVGRDDGFDELAAKLGVEDGEDDLDAPVQVAGHEVGTAEKNQWIAAVGEEIDPAVFEEAVDNTADADAFADPREPGAQTADASDQKIDGDALPRGGIKGIDDFLIHEAVGLDENAGRATGAPVGAFAVDEFQKAGGEIERRDEEFVKVRGFRHAG